MEIKGYTYGYCGGNGAYRTAEAIASQDLLFETGINWVCLAAAYDQEAYSSTKICLTMSTTRPTGISPLR